MAKDQSVLFVGGPGDGKVMPVPPRQRLMVWAGDDGEVTQYEIRRMRFLDRVVTVAAPRGWDAVRVAPELANRLFPERPAYMAQLADKAEPAPDDGE